MKKSLVYLTIFAAIAAVSSAAPVNFPVEFTDGAPETTTWGYDVNSPGGGYFARFTQAGLDGGAIYTGYSTAQAKCVFAGTSVDLWCKTQANGGPFEAYLDDGQATFTGTMNEANPGTCPKIITLFTGLSNTLHTLAIKNTGVSGSDFIFINKAVSEQPSPVTITRINDPDLTYAAPGDWGDQTDDNAINDCYGGETKYTVGGSSWSYTFTGTACAAVYRLRSDGGVVGYEVRDAGSNLVAAGSFPVYIPYTGATGYWSRWPFLLANNLPNGQYTATLTKVSGFISFVDAFYFVPGGTAVSDWSIY